MDLLFEECIAHRNVEHMLTSVFESRGFQEVITPGLEFFDIFSLECAGIPQESMYKLTDHKGCLLYTSNTSSPPNKRGRRRIAKTAGVCSRRSKIVSSAE